MHRWRAIFIVLVCLTAGGQLWAQESGWTIEAAEPGIFIELSTGLTSATNGVVIKYSDATLSARKAEWNEITGDVSAEGGVRIERQGQVWTGERLQFNFITGRVMAQDFRTGQMPFFAEGRAVVGDQRIGIYAAADGLVTTDDLAQPGYYVRAKSLVIIPGQYILAKGATVYLGKVPVMYFPYYRRNMKRHPNYWTATPGYRSLDGPYLLTSYNYYWNERLDGALHLDGRWKRGVGLGPDFNWHLPRYGEGTFKYYYIHDLEPPESSQNKTVNDDRQRVWFTHQASLTSNLTANAVVRYQSDELLTHDFFESEHRENPQPSTFVEVQRQWANFTLNLMAQPRVNTYQETVERLPELKLTGLRQQIGRTPFYYESDSSVGWYQREFAYDQTNAYSAFRADTFHQILLPWTFFHWLNVAPRVGGRFTYYGESDMYGSPLSERERGVFNTGMEVTFKASRVWSGARSRFFEVNGLRHIVEPSINYAYVPEPNRVPAELPQFDYQLPTTRLLPIEYPAYNSIDSIDSQNVLRFTLRNRLQTKRKHGVEDMLNWAVYLDWRLDPRYDQTTFSDLYSDLDLQPFSWLTLRSDLRYNVDNKQFDESNHGIILNPHSQWSIGLGHHYLRDDWASGLGTGNDLLYGSIYYRLNENWGLRALNRYDLKNSTMEEQQYTIYHDFRSWTGALTFRVRDNTTGPTDFTVAFTFSLKAFPRYKVGEDINKPSRLLGY